MARLQPFLPAPIKYRNGIMSHIAQQPPQSAREGTGNLIVYDNLGIAVYTEAGKYTVQTFRVRQWVAAMVRYRGAAQILLDISVDGAGYVRGKVSLPAGCFISKIETAINHPDGGFREGAIELGSVD
jgi:hypothetical protein